MITRNAMQLKAIMKNKARSFGITAQATLQTYCLERLLYRFAMSPYAESFIIKGGFLIASLIGIEHRSTMDIDTTIKGWDLTRETTERIFREICSLAVTSDQLSFTVNRLEDIREVNDYPGLRVFLDVKYDGLAIPVTVDVTTGDSIVPSEILYDYPCIFDDESIRIKAYPLENILAEKLETIVSRGTANTRPRDFYDVYFLSHSKSTEIDIDLLRQSLISTSATRGSDNLLASYKDTLARVKEDTTQQGYWRNWASKNFYAKGILFEDAVKSAMSLLDKLLPCMRDDVS